jgi:hypothetical protein
MESWPGEYPPFETSVVLTLNFAHFREDSSRAKAEPGANHCGDSERSAPACFSH